MTTGVYIKTPEHRQHLREALLGKSHPPERVEANRQGQLRRFLKPGERLKCSRAGRMPKAPRTGEYKRKLKQNAKARWANPDWRAKTSATMKEVANRPEVKERSLRRLREALNKQIRPNKPESLLLDLLNAVFPEQWEYTGNWAKMFGRKNPDFVSTNGDKLIIEVFGIYWHDVFDVARTIEFYKQYEYRVLVIWEDELGDTERIIDKIRRFMGRAS